LKIGCLPQLGPIGCASVKAVPLPIFSLHSVSARPCGVPCGGCAALPGV
jgi:hypothetical protein